jgi:RNA polymerase sigma-70 factor, ECF subfamily
LEDEAELIARVRAGSVEAFSEIVVLHQGRVRGFVGRFVRNPATIDDLAQDVFLAAYRSLDSYHGASSLSTWLLGIARNRALAFLRDEQRRRSRESGRLNAVIVAQKHEDAVAHPVDIAESEREIMALQECVKTLPQQSAALVEQHYLQARPSSEIARETGRSESAVRMTLLRIRHVLRDCIQKRLAGDGV